MPAATVGPVFWILAAMIVVSGILAVTLKNIFHSAPVSDPGVVLGGRYFHSARR